MEEEYKIIDNVIYTPESNRVIDERGIGWFYYENLKKNKNRRAQIDGLTGDEEDFGTLLVRCTRVAVRLKAKEIMEQMCPKHSLQIHLTGTSSSILCTIVFKPERPDYFIQNSILKILGRFSQRSVFLNLTELMLLCNTPKPENIDISGLKLITTAGSPTSKNHILKAKKIFPNVSLRICYGLSEVFQVTTSFNMEQPRHVELMNKKINSCGLPKPGIVFKYGLPISPPLVD
ncbi:hypothetical protein FQR65_LT04870 [Abscondita terminalis]|nr:hypothetical protein FQR65_LT04870 [Abscondita terminalis]